MNKGNEDLKAKIAKIQAKGKAQAETPMPTPEPEVTEDVEDSSMEELQAEFERKKKALQEKAKPKPEVAAPDLSEAISEYSDDGKFRVEVVFQLLQMNKVLNRIALALEGASNDE